jgi:hypothetical protein
MPAQYYYTYMERHPSKTTRSRCQCVDQGVCTQCSYLGREYYTLLRLIYQEIFNIRTVCSSEVTTPMIESQYIRMIQLLTYKPLDLDSAYCEYKPNSPVPDVDEVHWRWSSERNTYENHPSGNSDAWERWRFKPNTGTDTPVIVTRRSDFTKSIRRLCVCNDNRICIKCSYVHIEYYILLQMIYKELFDAVSSSSAVMRSPDVITWTKCSSDSQYVRIKQILGESSSAVMHSPDGITWTKCIERPRFDSQYVRIKQILGEIIQTPELDTAYLDYLNSPDSSDNALPIVDYQVFWKWSSERNAFEVGFKPDTRTKKGYLIVPTSVSERANLLKRCGGKDNGYVLLSDAIIN